MQDSKHRVVLRVLKSRVLRGVYKDRLPGERALAAELGVSAPTVKVALIQLEAVGLIERRQRAGTFVVEEKARLKTFGPMSVLLSQPISEEGVAESDVTYAFGQAAQARGLNLVLALHPRLETDKAIDEVLLHLRNPGCVGAALLAPRLGPAPALRLAEASGPVVMVDWETDDLILPTIVFDNREAGRLAAAHLLKLGHRRIAFADPLPLSPARRARAEAAAEMVRLFSGVFRLARHPDFDWGVPSCVELLRAPDRPTAVIGTGHKTCLEMAAAAASLGLGVPRDLSIVCMGNIMPERQEEPFTNISFDGRALGAGALEMLLGIEPGAEPEKRLVPVRLVDLGTAQPPQSA